MTALLSVCTKNKQTTDERGRGLVMNTVTQEKAEHLAYVMGLMRVTESHPCRQESIIQLILFEDN